MTDYYNPILNDGPTPTSDALFLSGRGLWFSHAEKLTRGAAPVVVQAADVPQDIIDTICASRAPLLGLDLSTPRIMGIVNTTPDSFSDGGDHFAHEYAVRAGRDMVRAGADLLDIGGESTRPGATFVPDDEEIDRTAPVIASLGLIVDAPLSIDTRKALVAQAAHTVGATLVNDVSGFTFDPGLASYCATHGLSVCVMHSQGEPQTMQDAPSYDDVLLDIFDTLKARVETLVALGIPLGRIVVDPGIGFGKTIEHNLAILRRLSLFHGLGCAILLGVSRKGFIGKIGQAAEPKDRAPGSIALGLAALAQGVQILRVHDVAETVQAVRLWQALSDKAE